MSDSRRLKKSESLEIRIPYPTKQAFMARCQAEGRSASETLRAYIETRIAPPSGPRRGWRYVLAGALAAGAMGAIAAPSLARPATDAAFHALDTDGDGLLTRAEFSRSGRRSGS
jgi:hypothetical protein